MTRSTTDPYHAVRHFSAAPWPGPRGELVRLTSDAVESIIAPADGCRLVSLRAFGHELLRQWDPERRAFQYGSFPMIPWVGRLDCGILRYQLNLDVAPDEDGRPSALLWLAGEEHRMGNGESLLWDDTYPHEVWNRSDRTRIALLLDVRRPAMPLDLRVLSRTITAGVGMVARWRGFD